MYAQFLADTAGLSEEARGVAFEGYLKTLKPEQAKEITQTDKEQVKPGVNTRKDATPVGKRTVADIEEELKKLGNPFFGM